MLFFNCIQNALFIAVTAFAAPDVAAPGEFAAPDDEFVELEDEDTEEVDERARTRCSAASGSSLTGRQWAMVWNSPQDPSRCLRQRLGGEAPASVPSCWKVARVLGCDQMISVD